VLLPTPRRNLAAAVSTHFKNKKDIMAIVEDKKYYHIQRNGFLEVGKTAFIGKTKNAFYGYFDKNGHNYCDPQSGKSINTYEIAENMVRFLNSNIKDSELEKFFSFDKDETIKHLTNTLGHYLRFTREHLFEEIRKDFFPDLPSRFRCLWIIPYNDDAVKYWWNTLGEKGRIFEISVSGKIHQTSQQYLNLSTNSFDFIKEQAFKYWTAKGVKNTKEDECLFEGFVKIESEKVITDFK
jgi:hypothetical protein